MKALIIWAGIAILSTIPLWAQQAGSSPSQNAPDVAAMQQQIRDLQDRLISLEGQVRMLKSAQPAPAPPPEAAATPSVTPPATPAPEAPVAAVTTPSEQTPTFGGAGGSAAKALNPDISVIGDFIGAAGNANVPPLAQQTPFPALQMHESEIGLQAIIDPYARGDFFISFGEEGVEPGRGLHHLHRAARKLRRQGREDAFRLR